MTVDIGFIGTGNMGGAVIQGLSGRQDLVLRGFDPDQERLLDLKERFGLIPEEDPPTLARKCSYILVAVKPGLVPQVVSQIAQDLDPSRCLVSLAAGIGTQDLVFWSQNACPVVRVMPNTPALIGQGIFAMCLEHEMLSAEQAEFVRNLLSELGQVHVLPEKSFDAFTALIGSGPAYVYHFMESLVDAGVLVGLGRQEATRMVIQLVAGSTEMASRDERHITQLKEMVTSPGGTTITGVRCLEKHGVKAAVMEAVEQACIRSRELGKR